MLKSMNGCRSSWHLNGRFAPFRAILISPKFPDHQEQNDQMQRGRNPRSGRRQLEAAVIPNGLDIAGVVAVPEAVIRPIVTAVSLRRGVKVRIGQNISAGNVQNVVVVVGSVVKSGLNLLPI